MYRSVDDSIHRLLQIKFFSTTFVYLLSAATLNMCCLFSSSTITVLATRLSTGLHGFKWPLDARGNLLLLHCNQTRALYRPLFQSQLWMNDVPLYLFINFTPAPLADSFCIHHAIFFPRLGMRRLAPSIGCFTMNEVALRKTCGILPQQEVVF